MVLYARTGSGWPPASAPPARTCILLSTGTYPWRSAPWGRSWTRCSRAIVRSLAASAPGPPMLTHRLADLKTECLDMPNRRALLASGLLHRHLHARTATAFGRDLSADPSHVGPAMLQKAQPVGYISYPSAASVSATTWARGSCSTPTRAWGPVPAPASWPGPGEARGAVRQYRQPRAAPELALAHRSGEPETLLGARTRRSAPRTRLRLERGGRLYATAVRAYIALGWAAPGSTRTPVDNHWWLDVETANSLRLR